MGFFADGRDEEIEAQEARELDGQFMTKSAASRAYLRFTHIFPKVLKYSILAIIVLIYGLFFFRIQTSKAPSELRQWQWTADAITQYQINPDGFALFSQEQPEDISESKISIPKAGSEDEREIISFVFATSYIQYSPTANQFQLTARYNRGMEESLKKVFALESLPQGEWFSFALTDENGNIYPASYTTAGQRNVNHFRRLVFCNVPMDTVKELNLIVCYAPQLNFERPLFEMNVYRNTLVSEPIKVDAPQSPNL